MRLGLNDESPEDQELRGVIMVVSLVTEHFGEAVKAQLWFSTANPILGGITPMELIQMGQVAKLLGLVQDMMSENKRI